MKNKIPTGFKKGVILGLLCISSLCWAESKYRPPIEWLEKRQAIIDEYQNRIKFYKDRFYREVDRAYEFYVTNSVGRLVEALSSDNYRFIIQMRKKEYLWSTSEFRKEKNNKLKELKVEFQSSTGRPVDPKAKGREYAWLNRSYVSYVEHPEYLSKRAEIIAAYNEQVEPLREELMNKLKSLYFNFSAGLISEEEYKKERKKLYAEYGETVKPIKEWMQEALFNLRREYRRKYPAISGALYKGDPKYIEAKEIIVSNYEDSVREIRKNVAEEIAGYRKSYKEGQITYSQYRNLVNLARIRRSERLASLKALYYESLLELENRYRLKYGLGIKQ